MNDSGRPQIPNAISTETRISAHPSSLGGYWARLVLGTILSLFLGTEVIVFGPMILAFPPILLGLVILYLVVFSVADDLIVRFGLTDRESMVLAAVMCLLFGGIGNQEMFEQNQAMPLQFFGLNPLSVILDCVAWGVFLVWVMHLMRQIRPRVGQSSLMTWRGWIGTSFGTAFIAVNYFANVRQPDRWMADLSLLVLAVAGAFWLALLVWRRFQQEDARTQEKRAVPKSQPIIFMALSFVMISILSIPLGWQNALPVPLHLVLFMLLYIPLTILIMARTRIAI